VGKGAEGNNEGRNVYLWKEVSLKYHITHKRRVRFIGNTDITRTFCTDPYHPIAKVGLDQCGLDQGTAHCESLAPVIYVNTQPPEDCDPLVSLWLVVGKAADFVVDFILVARCDDKHVVAPALQSHR
jgi:hypothetical protein